MAIDFVYNVDFKLNNELTHKEWLVKAVNLEGYSLQNIVYAFFDDEALKQLNVKFLNHNYYTDVISFNDSEDHSLKGNVAISIDRVRENAKEFSSSFDDELRRVMIHGLLHFMGYNDSTEEENSLAFSLTLSIEIAILPFRE